MRIRWLSRANHDSLEHLEMGLHAQHLQAQDRAVKDVIDKPRVRLTLAVPAITPTDAGPPDRIN